ncbi:hypothetical protein P389DRAFT_179469 [Cystobasidium minutum MCA 4210]|uniref:uncharacterized protein n=1 Tax=Cystobasidium minutum MCA 4210 TaxID=1397322 RepID=UPI0034CF836E|eukprot:jgi/Rhomi1/179469/fgenesh1_pg.3_\
MLMHELSPANAFVQGHAVNLATSSLVCTYKRMEDKYKTASALNDTLLKQHLERQQIFAENERLRKQVQELEIKVQNATKDIQAKLDEERSAHRATQAELEALEKHNERIQEMFKQAPAAR